MTPGDSRFENLDSILNTLDSAIDRLADMLAARISEKLKNYAGGRRNGIDASHRPERPDTEQEPAQVQRTPKRRKPVKPCSVEGCDQPARAKGLCSRHYQRQRYAERRKEGAGTVRGTGTCEVEGCEEKIYAKNMCSKHFMAWVRQKRKEND
ncbi:MAG: hypothetical protein D6806_01415 [Deltaproteobacteria bacterium]|nr:MAG: hypothetical protein D6806_01415 [Deltaproteobacteria bacterium]